MRKAASCWLSLRTARETAEWVESGSQRPQRVCQVGREVTDVRPVLLSRNDDGRAAEQYRIVRTRILQDSREPAFVVVSSPSTGDGKTVTAVNLAVLFALRSDDRIVLIDADLRRPSVHERLKISRTPGLTEVLNGKCRLEDALCRVEPYGNLYVLPAGAQDPNPAELFNSIHWKELVRAVREQFHRQIADAPPVGAVADCDLITKASDGLILVVRPDHTSRDLCQKALDSVEKKLLGVLLNGVEEWMLWKPYPPYYYHMRSSNNRG